MVEALERGGGGDAEGVDTTSRWQEDRRTEGVMCRWVC